MTLYAFVLTVEYATETYKITNKFNTSHA